MRIDILNIPDDQKEHVRKTLTFVLENLMGDRGVYIIDMHKPKILEDAICPCCHNTLPDGWEEDQLCPRCE